MGRGYIFRLSRGQCQIYSAIAEAASLRCCQRYAQPKAKARSVAFCGGKVSKPKSKITNFSEKRIGKERKTGTGLEFRQHRSCPNVRLLVKFIGSLRSSRGLSVVSVGQGRAGRNQRAASRCFAANSIAKRSAACTAYCGGGICLQVRSQSGRPPASPPVLVEMPVSRFGREVTGSPQPPPVLVEMPVSRFGREVTGRLRRLRFWWRCLSADSVAKRPAARSRPRAEGCAFTSQARPLGCGLVPNENRCRRHRRAAASRRRRPATRVPTGPLRACAPQAAARPSIRCRICVRRLHISNSSFFISALRRPCKPQPGAGRGPQFPPEHTCTPQAATRPEICAQRARRLS